MNKKVILLVTLFLLIIVTIGIYENNKPIKHSTSTSGYVTRKTEELVGKNVQYYIDILTFSDSNSKDGTERTKIKVSSKETWISIKENKAYFLTFEWTDHETPRLLQISLNEKFMELYNENLKRK